MTSIDLGATPFAPLAVHLLDLLHKLDGQEVPLIMVGGFGLFLRRLSVQQSNAPTLYEIIPDARATEDFDIVLKLTLLADLAKMQALRAAFDSLDYRVVEAAQEYQFFKPGSSWNGHRDVKFDILARARVPEDPELYEGGVRLMPRQKHNPLHAYRTPEAIAIEEGVKEVALSGPLTSGDLYEGTVYLPSPYALYLMKLFAFRDEAKGRQRRPPRVEYARKHAIDLYTLSALLAAEEYDGLPAYRDRYGSHAIAQEAGAIVKEYFGTRASLGAVRLQEHGDFPNVNRLNDFLLLLSEIFPS